MRIPPTTVLTLFGSRQIREFTALAKLRWSADTIPMRKASARGADMFINVARTMYNELADTASGANARLSMKTVERPWAMTIARTLPNRFDSRALPIAANAIVKLATARTGPL